jgi:hypothetical protein
MRNGELVFKESIAFWHPIALMYHLHTFTSVLNENLFAIAPLYKKKN